MIGALIMLVGITAIVWTVILLDERSRRIECAERAARTGTPSQDPSKHPA